MRAVDYVDPRIGTVGDEQATSFHGGGKTHPGACCPGGMVQLSPDTVTGGDNGTGYNYCQNTIEGFSFNHMSGIGWYGDLGNLQIMPVTGDTDLRSGSNEEVPFLRGTEGWKSSFSHEEETAQAGYYAVRLSRYGIYAEATVTPRTGLLRFTYPAHSASGILFNFSRRIGGHADYQKIELTAPNRVEGHIHCTPAGGGFGRGQGGIGYDLYFSCELSKAPAGLRFFENESFAPEGLTHYEGEDVGMLARFSTREGETILLRCGISYVDLEGARNNLCRECPDFDFDRVRAGAEAMWEKAFSCLAVEGGDPVDRTLFYTCLYHTLLDPRTAMDADGRVRHADGAVERTAYTHRTMFSGWDVYRSEFPLLTLIAPETVNDEASSLLTVARRQNRSFPRWELMGLDSRCMVGDPGLLVVADAYVKGIRRYDTDAAYDIALASSRAAEEREGKPFASVRPRHRSYIEEAYTPGDISSTLELLLADYAMHRFAAARGETEDAAHFLARARRYGENLNPQTGFMGPRDESGAFLPVRDEYDTRGCVESNLFQQSWFVPYDIAELCRRMGTERAVALLERLFEGADLTALWNENYNHSNEPCHNLTHYFNVLGLPHRTQYWTRRVQKEAYRTGAFGFCGNEDVGQLSAWYVLSAIGFAQLCPGDPIFAVNTPLFSRVILRLDPTYHTRRVADTFTVACDRDPLTYPYIRGMELNGTPLTRTYLTYEEITAGGVLRLSLCETPCPALGGDPYPTVL